MVVLAVPHRSYRSTQRINDYLCCIKTVLCRAGTDKLTRGGVFRWKSFDSVNPSVPVFYPPPPLPLSHPTPPPPFPYVYMKTLPIYLNCVRCCVAKIFLNQRIHPVRVSVCLSVLSVHPSLLHAFYSKPNVLESIRNRSRTRPPCPAEARVQYASVPSIRVLYINHSQDQKKQKEKKGGDNPSKEDLAVINVAYSFFFFFSSPKKN